MNKNKKRKVLTIMLALAMVASVGATSVAVNSISSVSVNAADTLTTEDGFSYEVIGDTDTVRITGYSKNGKIAIPSEIDGKTVVEIKKGAFENKTGLQKVSIPGTVKKIGDNAFTNCKGLRTVEMAEGLEIIGGAAFYGCIALKQIEIPDSVKSIESNHYRDADVYGGAFQNCTSLKNVKIGNGVTKIGERSFANCTSLQELTIGNSVENIGEYAFYNCKNLKSLKIPKSVKGIGEYAFNSCKSLDKVSIPSGVKILSNSAFADCTNLQNVVISNSVKTIDERAFYGCTALKQLEIPDSVNIIGISAFEDCTSMETVKIGNGVTEIDGDSFKNCTSLRTLTIGNSVESIFYRAFYGCESLTEVTLPDSLREMAGRVFENCKKLETVVMRGENIICIPVRTFYGCTSLKNVNIGTGVTTISPDAFTNCTSLEEITIPDSVTIIECDKESYFLDSIRVFPEGVFGNCTNLKKVVIPESVVQIDDWSFKNHSENLVIYGYTNDCEAKRYADSHNIKYKLIKQHEHIGKWTTVREANDKNSGTKIEKCTICGELMDVKIIPPHEHKYGTEWKSDSKNHWHECSCGDKADVAEHNLKEIVDKEATETETGLKHQECTVCGYKGESEVIEKIPHEHKYGTEWKSDGENHWHECSCGDKTDVAEHIFKEIIDKEATTTETGLKHKECTTCGYKTEGEIIPLIHEHSYGEEWKSDGENHWHECTVCGDKADVAEHIFKEIIDKEATTTETGLKHKECTTCGYNTESEIIPLVHEHSYGEEWKSDDQNHWHECTTCGDKTDVAEHTFKEVTDKEATTTETGLKHKECTVCGYKGESEVIEKIPHDHNYGTEWKSDNKNHWHECSCGDKADVAEHIFKEIIDKEATETETGLKHKECTVCGYKTESEIIDKITPEHKHSYGTEWKSDNKNHWHECSCGDKTDVAEHTFKEVVDKKATKTETGLKHKECTVCGYKGENIVIKVDSTPAEIIDNNNNNSNKGTNNNSNNGTNNSSNTDTENKSVNTGDSMMPITVASVLGLGAVTVFVVNFKKRKDNHNS